jgi:4-diphosphocytidyl-2-C-methyl-D-erythritol kinase
MVSFPPCKINLGLHIINKRPDGYHNLETCFYPVPWTDVLEIIPSEKFDFTSSGNEIGGNPAHNLCVKAYELLKNDFSLAAARIHLHKIIPTGAGLGGGSADAAYTIRMLNEIFNLRLTQEKMMFYAASIGSDTAFFIQDQAMLGAGRGEILSPTTVDIRGKFLVLVNPNVHVSTADAYARIRPQQPERSLSDLLAAPITEWKHHLKNAFEESVFERYPQIKSIKEKLYALEAIYACMSGTGATVFGIFDAEISPELHFPGTTVWSGYL